uniref:Uncharacterized protein n=1 Tax=Arundo donax TaxID=35708 RepID=A0A0A9A6W1_ARUDO
MISGSYYELSRLHFVSGTIS